MTVADKPTMRYRARLGGVVIGIAELRSVPVDVIKLDPVYQRGTNRRWVNDHMPFNEKQASTLVLSGRAGGPYCIDGGHRLELAKASSVSHVNAFVIEDLSQQQEARLFTHYQRERRNLSSHDLFRADCASGDEDTLAMVRIVTNAGFQLVEKSRSGPSSITAIDACRYIQRYGGDELLARTLGQIKTFWIGYDKALSGQVLKGMALFLSSAGEQAAFQREVFAKVMTDNAPVRILGYAQQNATKRISSSTSAADVAEAFWQQYNKRTGREQQLSPLTISGRKRPVRQPRMDQAPRSFNAHDAVSRGVQVIRKAQSKHGR
jgi:hypothetical protein